VLRWLAGPGWHKCAAWLQFSAGSASLVDGYDCSNDLSCAELLLLTQRRRASLANPKLALQTKLSASRRPCVVESSSRRLLPSSMEWRVFETGALRAQRGWSPHSTVQQPIKHGRCCNPRTIRIGHTSHSSPNYIKWRNSWSSPLARAPCCSSLQDALA